MLSALDLQPHYQKAASIHALSFNILSVQLGSVGGKSWLFLIPGNIIVLDSNNPVINLCIEGTQAEFQGQNDGARSLYQKAWEAAQDDFEACIAAHYVARLKADPHEKLRWNQIALDKAKAIADQRVDDFYPSLYLNMGRSFELLGRMESATRYYNLAAELGFPHRDV